MKLHSTGILTVTINRLLVTKTIHYIDINVLYEIENDYLNPLDRISHSDGPFGF